MWLLEPSKKMAPLQAKGPCLENYEFPSLKAFRPMVGDVKFPKMIHIKNGSCKLCLTCPHSLVPIWPMWQLWPILQTQGGQITSYPLCKTMWVQYHFLSPLCGAIKHIQIRFHLIPFFLEITFGAYWKRHTQVTTSFLPLLYFRIHQIQRTNRCKKRNTNKLIRYKKNVYFQISLKFPF